ncbi:hypothetical protein Gotri_011912 [Gossypium trilobum]|uniref:RING-type E3 ubiquitin transferase n=1 Tax=Gossypium trilobum TaxID=34281 RepID=A0A7J9DNG0_9ROSI|nr:hypothetical protein [Gossypium trilobum]
MPSAFYNTLVQEIMGCGVGIANRTFDSAWYCKVMYLHSTIQALLVESEINQETLMSRALAESRSEFERINNGMVAATESSIKEMIEKVKVEAGDEEKCMICLEEVEVGFEASQMPCSHVFHDDCIKKWLKQTTESSIKEMIEKVKVEAGDEEKCMICLEEVEVGFEASQMPCSHVFHDDCIKKWLKQSHYCPICRFEMPID